VKIFFFENLIELPKKSIEKKLGWSFGIIIPSAHGLVQVDSKVVGRGVK
jgi:hypothetical protein